MFPTLTSSLSSTSKLYVLTRLVGAAEFVKRLSTQNRNIFQKIFDEIKYLVKVTTAGSKEQRKLLEIQKIFEQAYRESGTVETEADVKYALEQVDGIDYVRAEKNIFTKEDGTVASEREIFNSLVGKTIHLPEGDVEIVKRLPGKDMYNELYRRYPKNMGDVENPKQLNSDVNYNMEELLDSSNAKELNTPDYHNRHQAQGISGFDTRTVKFYDGTKAYDIDFSIATLKDGRKIAYAKKFFGYDADLTKKIQAAEGRSIQRGLPLGTRLCLQSVVCYTLCRRCRENAVAAGEGVYESPRPSSPVKVWDNLSRCGRSWSRWPDVFNGTHSFKI